MFQLETNNCAASCPGEWGRHGQMTQMSPYSDSSVGVIWAPLNNTEQKYNNRKGGNIWRQRKFVTKLHQLLKSAFGYKESNFVKLKFIDDSS